MASIAVLGCGPAGLFAAHAARNLGHMPVIISKKQKSVIYGAQYLHEPIPDLTNPTPDGEIQTYRLGTAAGYALRVYGNGKQRTSWLSVREGKVGIWDLRKTYERAWQEYEGFIQHEYLNADSIKYYLGEFEYVVSAVPRWALCAKPNEHFFHSVPIMVIRRMEYTGLRTFFDNGNNGVVYNGTTYGDWYRTACIFGSQSTEAVSSPEFLRGNPDAEPGFKVVGTDCDCHPELIRVGRLGRWERGILTHHAYEETMRRLAD